MKMCLNDESEHLQSLRQEFDFGIELFYTLLDDYDFVMHVWKKWQIGNPFATCAYLNPNLDQQTKIEGKYG